MVRGPVGLLVNCRPLHCVCLQAVCVNVRPYNGAGQLLTTPQTLHDIVFISQLLSREVKSVLVKHLYSAYQNTSYHVSTFLDIKKNIEELKSDLIRSHSTVIKLQAELLEIKSNQLESVQSTVKTGPPFRTRFKLGYSHTVKLCQKPTEGGTISATAEESTKVGALNVEPSA